MEGQEEEEKEKKSNFQKHRVKLVLKKGIKKGEKRSSDASLVPASTYTEHPTIQLLF